MELGWLNHKYQRVLARCPLGKMLQLFLLRGQLHLNLYITVVMRILIAHVRTAFTTIGLRFI